MQIIQKPEGLLFEKNIPDLVLQKQGTETGVTVTIKFGSMVVIAEKYVYDAEGYIHVRQLHEVLSARIQPAPTSLAGIVTTIGVICPFTLEILNGAVVTSIQFSILKCDADMPADVDADVWITKNFLTRLPRLKRTATNLNEYLSYVHLANYASVVVKFAAHFIDSGGQYLSKMGDFLTVDSAAGDCFISFNASLAALRTAANLPTETILQYDLWFTEAALAVDSKPFTFLVDPNFYRHKTNFVFVNSFGVLETFTATGLTEAKISNEVNLANIQSRYRKTSQDFVSEKTTNTGFLSADEMEWLNDLLLSYNVAIYIPGIGMSEEITLTSHDKTDTEANVLQAFKFNYRRAKNNHLLFEAANKGIFDQTFDSTFE